MDIVFWAVLAALAFAGELLSVSFFLLFFSLGALVSLLMAFAGLGSECRWQGSSLLRF